MWLTRKDRLYCTTKHSDIQFVHVPLLNIPYTDTGETFETVWGTRHMKQVLKVYLFKVVQCDSM